MTAVFWVIQAFLITWLFRRVRHLEDCLRRAASLKEGQIIDAG